MPYITNEDIQTRVGPQAFVQLADDDGDGVADVSIVNEIRLAAEGELDSYLAGRYALPVDLTAAPELADLLASVTLDLAEYRLRVRRPPIPADVTRLYEQTQRWLARIADGSIDLPAATPPAPATTRGPSALTTGRPRSIDLDELSAW